ncbi:hypothetical protein [Paraburkholderia youngii]
MQLEFSELTPFTSLTVVMLARQNGLPVMLINALAGCGYTNGIWRSQTET